MFSKICSFTFGILAALTVCDLLGHSLALDLYTHYMDHYCRVYKNYTEIDKDNQANRPASDCVNKTLSSLNRNTSEIDKYNCLQKCIQVTIGATGEDGIFSSNFPTQMKEWYNRYTNATAAYVQNLAAKFTHCAKMSEEKIQALKKNGTEVHECTLNGLYRDCWKIAFFSPIKNTTEALRARCGDQLGE